MFWRKKAEELDSHQEEPEGMAELGMEIRRKNAKEVLWLAIQDFKSEAESDGWQVMQRISYKPSGYGSAGMELDLLGGVTVSYKEHSPSILYRVLQITPFELLWSPVRVIDYRRGTPFGEIEEMVTNHAMRHWRELDHKGGD